MSNRNAPGNIKAIGDKGASTKFQPGKSGNPGGKPAVAHVLAEAGTSARELTVDLLRRAIQELDNPQSVASWCYAHMWITERVLKIAKPKETIAVAVSRVDTTELEQLTDEELLALADRSDDS